MKDELHKQGVCIWTVQTNMKSLDSDGTPNPIANLVFTQLLAVYEMENETKKQHIKSGLQNARAKGVVLGRPLGSTQDKIAKYPRIVNLIKEQKELADRGQKSLSIRKMAAFLGQQKSLIQNVKKEMVKVGMLGSTIKVDRRSTTNQKNLSI